MRFKFSHKVGDFAPSTKTSTRTIDEKGFLHIVDVKMTKAPQVREYYAYEFGAVDGFKPDSIIKVYSSQDELFTEKTIASFQDVTFTNSHPDGNEVNSATWSEYAAGDVKNVRRDGEFLTSDLVVKDATAITQIQSNTKIEISIGYSAALVMESGIAPDGTTYDAKWVDILGDHVAMVKYGRAGSECRIGDLNQTRGETMPMKIIIDGLPHEVEENATLKAAVDKQNAKLAAFESTEIKIGDKSFKADEAVAIQAVVDAALAEKAELTTKVEALSKTQVSDADLDALVAKRAAVIADAKRLIPSIVTDGKSNAQIMLEVVTANKTNAVVAAIVGDAELIDGFEGTATAFKAFAASVNTNAPSTTTVIDQALNNKEQNQPTKSRADARADAWK